MKHAISKSLSKYGLKPYSIEERELKSFYMQARPNHEFMNDVLGDTKSPQKRFSMINSPHFEFATLYYKNGKKWMMNNYDKTRYKTMCFNYKRKKKFPQGFICLCDSVRGGYLRDKYSEDYIVILDESFARSRFKRSVLNLVPEVWSGHHRIGAILALNSIGISSSTVDVVVAKDRTPGTMRSAGKIHKLCVK